ncbi:hypothetical protein EAO28_19795 [Klebsiella pneumoniae]|uniref:3-phosphoshikimate 1-carboxyvinyltransferase n=1 Tax=Klebsiella pneumoniae TaxID=573 RepID=A0A3P2EHW0_KLEPN|nr:hypothetical protein [Klebsiella pneumoniae]RRE43866.1 hypothetical protein EAO28_19795 [Klebsiella pneumoniae]HBX5307638.1 hypothetical protein [Klebsiella pneumoniae]HBZ1105803.1 hypothetical protein [Klebsiella pneumoniae]
MLLIVLCRMLRTSHTAIRQTTNHHGELRMPNHHIMALALALCNAGTNSRVTIPRLTGKELKLLLEWLSVLRATL